MTRPISPAACMLNFIFALLLAASSGGMAANAAASPWAAAHKAKARLVSGPAIPSDSGAVLTFVEIALEPGWKTYWRSAGDAGGLAPSFDWAGSTNLASADVMFPAPRRFTDRSGNTIGYEDALVLPVALRPENAEKPISLKLDLHYGICKDVCIPVQAQLALDVVAGEDAAVPEELKAALDKVPRAQGELRPGDPVLVSAGAVLGGGNPKITIEAQFPGGDAGADVFLEAPDGLFLPLPERTDTGEPRPGDALVFVADLSSDVDLAALRGKPINLTMVSETGASSATFILE